MASNYRCPIPIKSRHKRKGSNKRRVPLVKVENLSLNEPEDEVALRRLGVPSLRAFLKARRIRCGKKLKRGDLEREGDLLFGCRQALDTRERASAKGRLWINLRRRLKTTRVRYKRGELKRAAGTQIWNELLRATSSTTPRLVKLKSTRLARKVQLFATPPKTSELQTEQLQPEAWPVEPKDFRTACTDTDMRRRLEGKIKFLNSYVLSLGECFRNINVYLEDLNQELARLDYNDPDVTGEESDHSAACSDIVENEAGEGGNSDDHTEPLDNDRLGVLPVGEFSDNEGDGGEDFKKTLNGYFLREDARVMGIVKVLREVNGYGMMMDTKVFRSLIQNYAKSRKLNEEKTSTAIERGLIVLFKEEKLAHIGSVLRYILGPSFKSMVKQMGWGLAREMNITLVSSFSKKVMEIYQDEGFAKAWLACKGGYCFCRGVIVQDDFSAHRECLKNFLSKAGRGQITFQMPACFNDGLFLDGELNEKRFERRMMRLARQLATGNVHLEEKRMFAVSSSLNLGIEVANVCSERGCGGLTFMRKHHRDSSLALDLRKRVELIVAYMLAEEANTETVLLKLKEMDVVTLRQLSGCTIGSMNKAFGKGKKNKRAREEKMMLSSSKKPKRDIVEDILSCFDF